MKHTPPALEIDVIFEHGGRQATLKGSGHIFVATFPTLLSLIHFWRVLRGWRNKFPTGYGLRIEWRGVRVRLHAAKHANVI